MSPLSIRNVIHSIEGYIASNDADITKLLFGEFSLLGFGRLDGNTPSPQLISTIDRGVSHLRNNNYNAFEETLQVALKISNDFKNVFGIIFIYDLLANGAFMNKEYDKARDLLTKVIKMMFDQGVPENDPKILHISLKLSKIHEVLNDYKNAEIGYSYCIRRLENKIRFDPENEEVLGVYAITLNTYGYYSLTEGRPKIAKTCFRKAYNASVKLNGEVFEMNVILLNDLGSLYYGEEKLDQALHYLQKAEAIGQHLPDMKNFAMIQVNLCYIYLQQGMVTEAEKHCMEGMTNAIRHGYDEGKKEAEMCLAEIINFTKCKM